MIWWQWLTCAAVTCAAAALSLLAGIAFARYQEKK
jgi:hypothetical protein